MGDAIPRLSVRHAPVKVQFLLKEENTSVETLSPADVFNLIYQGLDPLVQENLHFEQQIGTAQRRLRHETRKPFQHSKESAVEQSIERSTSDHLAACERLSDAWLYTPQRDIVANVIFADGAERDYSIERRTNFDADTLYKRPNIVHLVTGDGRLVLRESLVHSLDDLVIPIMARRKLLKAGRAQDFKREDSTQFSTQNGGNRNPAAEPLKHGKFMYLPEPQLLAALERVYAEKDLPRITPEITVLGHDPQKMWYLREFLPNIFDTRPSYTGLGAYLGQLHALGLIEAIDRQWKQYCEVGRSGQRGGQRPAFEVGTIDPDFFLYTNRPQLIEAVDWKDIQQMVLEDGPGMNLPVHAKEYVARLEEARDKTVRELAKRGINPRTLFDGYLHKGIETSPFRKAQVIY